MINLFVLFIQISISIKVPSFQYLKILYKNKENYCDGKDQYRDMCSNEELAISKMKKNQLLAGQIAGIIVGCVAFVAIIVIFIALCTCCKPKEEKKISENEDDLSVGL